MASLWRKTMVYLGLGPDEEYDDYDPDPREVPPAPEAAAPPPRPRPARQAPPPMTVASPEPEGIGAVRTLPPPPSTGPERPTPMARAQSSAVRPLAPSASGRPHVVAPTSFNEAQEVADRFKEGQPVIVNLQQADRDLSRRLIDFASGLCYGIEGHMERVANQVYLLTPSDVVIPPEERRRLQERGLYD